MKIILSATPRFLLQVVIGFALLMSACRIGQDPHVENVLSFSHHFESLSQYDSLFIEVKNPDGKLLGVIFQGKAESANQLDKLDVPGWEGGPIVILISGFMNGKTDPVYKEEKRYNGTTGKTDTSIVATHPNPTLSAQSLALILSVGQRNPLPRVDLKPANLAEPALRWSSNSPGVLAVDGGFVMGVSPGPARLTAKLVRDTTVSIVFTVEVTAAAGTPRLEVVADSVVPAGATVTFRVKASQVSGTLSLFQWSLDGDLLWDDSLSGPWSGTNVDLPSVSHTYTQPGPVTARFRVQDGEGVLGLVTWVLRVVGSGSAVSIDSPENNSYTNQSSIMVDWSVHGVRQDTLTTEALIAIGPNTITRSARDSAGKLAADTITVYLDTTPPQKPILAGTSPTNTKPKWTWSSGGGGSGDYRFRLGDSLFTPISASTRESTYTLADNPVSGLTYTLYLQERDQAGNWSSSATLPIRFDESKPAVAIIAPLTSGTFYTAASSVALSGTASGLLPITKVAYRLGTGSYANATLTDSGWSTPAINLQESVPVVVTVIAEDQAGNSGEAELTLFQDATPPGAPAITTWPNPVISLLRGTFAWNAGTDGTAGSGLNGRYRYNLNGGPWKDTSEALLSDLPLVVGSNVFAVQEQDRALQWSVSATRTVRVDNAGPVITLTSHTNPVATQSLIMTLSGTVRDTGSAVAAMTVSGQESGSGTVSVSGSTWTTAALTLKSGANTLLLTATDTVENIRTLSVTVNVSLPAPVVVITNPADSLTVTNQSTLMVSYTIDGGATQAQTFTLATDGAHRLEVASPPNASGNIGRDTVKVTRDATAPLPPNVPAPVSPTRLNAIWNWTSQGDNTGGAGMRSPALYRFSLNNGTTWTETGVAQHQIATEGTHTLVVQEQDRAGNWSPSSTPRTVMVDKTAPTVAISWPTRDNYVTNKASITIQYKVDNGNVTQTPCDLSVTDGRNTCRVQVDDAVGNSGWDSTYVWRRGNVVFVTPEGAGLGDGSDWENALNSSGLVAALEKSSMANKAYWLGTGSYPHLGATYNAILLGGFIASGFPYNTNNRNITASRLDGFGCGDNTSIGLNGFSLRFLSGANAPTVTLTDITIIPPDSGAEFSAFFFQQPGTTIIANNVVIEEANYSYSVLLVDGTVTFNGGAIRDNHTINNPLEVIGTTTLNSPFVISGNQVGNSSLGDHQVRVLGSGRLIIGPQVSLSCDPAAGQVIIEPGGTCINQ